MRIFALLSLLLLPVSAVAQEHDLTRREAYLLIWESISRPVFETAKSYDDVEEEDQGYPEISYGKRRGILEDEDTFRPDDPVTLEDALLWIFRTRNVRELPDMQKENLVPMMNDYPIAEMNRALDSGVTTGQLFTMMQKLDGMLVKEVHEVSFYADDFHGQGTAFGETFDMNDITAAHRSYPHNTLVRVTNVANGESVVVRINDRGPYVDGRDMDLSKAAFGKIAHHGEGIIHATFERLGDVELVDRCQQKQRLYQKRITRDTRFFRGVPHTFSINDQLVLQSNRVFVVRGITFPDGQYLRVQDFVHLEEKYYFTPDTAGPHIFHIGDAFGHMREFMMTVQGC